MDNIQVKDENIIITTIQSLWRGYNLRKKMQKLNDNYTFELLNECIEKYIRDIKFNDKINALLSKKKRRNENFPSDISENIAKFAIFQKYGIMPCWDTDKGDIIINKLTVFKQLEIKGFMSDGPSSFGPTENWDWIYFVDARDIRNRCFKVYEIKLSNKNEIFRSIKLTKKENYGEIADNNQRGKLRSSFEKIKPQLEQYCNLIFDGHISKLDNTI
jgi:hypothetical protein